MQIIKTIRARIVGDSIVISIPREICEAQEIKAGDNMVLVSTTSGKCVSIYHAEDINVQVTQENGI